MRPRRAAGGRRAPLLARARRCSSPATRCTRNRFLWDNEDGDDVDIWAVLSRRYYGQFERPAREARVDPEASGAPARVIWSYTYTASPAPRATALTEPLSDPRMFLLWNALEGIQGTLYAPGRRPRTRGRPARQPAAARRVRAGLPGRRRPDRERAARADPRRDRGLGRVRHRPPQARPADGAARSSATPVSSARPRSGVEARLHRRAASSTARPQYSWPQWSHDAATAAKIEAAHLRALQRSLALNRRGQRRRVSAARPLRRRPRRSRRARPSRARGRDASPASRGGRRTAARRSAPGRPRRASPGAPVRRRAPDREAPVAVVIRQHHHERALLPDEEGRRAVREPLARLGQRERDLAQPREDPLSLARVHGLYSPGVADLPLTGGCLCGGVRYEISAPLVVAELLPLHPLPAPHRQRAAVLRAGRRPARSESPPARSCSTRGTRRTAVEGCLLLGLRRRSLVAEPGRPGAIAVRMGTFDCDPGIRPSHHQFTAYAAVWEPIPDDGLPRYPERRPTS